MITCLQYPDKTIAVSIQDNHLAYQTLWIHSTGRLQGGIRILPEHFPMVVGRAIELLDAIEIHIDQVYKQVQNQSTIDRLQRAIIEGNIFGSSYSSSE